MHVYCLKCGVCCRQRRLVAVIYRDQGTGHGRQVQGLYFFPPPPLTWTTVRLSYAVLLGPACGCIEGRRPPHRVCRSGQGRIEQGAWMDGWMNGLGACQCVRQCTTTSAIRNKHKGRVQIKIKYRGKKKTEVGSRNQKMKKNMHETEIDHYLFYRNLNSNFKFKLWILADI